MSANSGAALVVIQATGIERGGRISHGCFGLYSDDCEAALARVVAHCRRHGTAKLLAFSLLTRGAASAQRPKAVRRWVRTVPVGDDCSTPPFRFVQVANSQSAADDVARVRDGLLGGQSARFALISTPSSSTTAHGYLLHSFVSPLSNRRSDGYAAAFRSRSRKPCAERCQRGCRSAHHRK